MRAHLPAIEAPSKEAEAPPSGRGLVARTPAARRAARLLGLALCAASLILPIGLTTGVEAKTLRFAFQGEVKAVQPYAISETFSLSVNNALYEGLVRRTPDLTIE